MTELTINAVGDVYFDRPAGERPFAGCADVLVAADLRFGNNECAYLEPNASSAAHRLGVQTAAHTNLDLLRAAQFDVMSCSNNHILDDGLSGLTTTIGGLEWIGVRPVGAAHELDQARAPVILDRHGVKVAFLAYTCVGGPAVQNQAADRPGIGFIKVHTFYEMAEPGQPGTPGRTRAFVDSDAMEQVRADVGAAAGAADHVIVSVHWGIHLAPFALAGYERDLGRAVINAGASAVLGHHQHILKGIERYGAGYIFYGMGNFVFDLRLDDSYLHDDFIRYLVKEYGEYAPAPLPGYPTYPFHPDARKAIIAHIHLSATKVESAGVFPCWIGRDGFPVCSERGGEEWNDVCRYLETASREIGSAISFETNPASSCCGAVIR